MAAEQERLTAGLVATHPAESGRSEVTVRCPFCGGKTRGSAWAIAGSGKRCATDGCGAVLAGSRGGFSARRARR